MNQENITSTLAYIAHVHIYIYLSLSRCPKLFKHFARMHIQNKIVVPTCHGKTLSQVIHITNEAHTITTKVSQLYSHVTSSYDI